MQQTHREKDFVSQKVFGKPKKKKIILSWRPGVFKTSEEFFFPNLGLVSFEDRQDGWLVCHCCATCPYPAANLMSQSISREPADLRQKLPGFCPKSGV